MEILAGYLILINLFGFLCMRVDKQRARKQQWRIPEKTLFFISFIGGSIGIFCGMYTFRHKTRHNTFRFGVPVIFLGQTFILLMVLRYFKMV